MFRIIFSTWAIYLFFSCANPTTPEKKQLNDICSNSLLPNLGIDNGMEVVTWNIENFPKAGQATIDSVANIINCLNADIYCLQEISNISSFRELVDLTNEYDYVESTATDYLNLVVLYKKNSFIVNNQSNLFTDYEYEFAYRPPLKLDMTFIGSGEPFDFTLINMHLKCCDNGYSRRVASAELLYNYLNSSRASGVVNHIIVGDWNDDISDDYSVNSFNIFLEDMDNYKYVTYEHAHSSSNFYDSFPSYPSFIDHIMISEDLFNEHDSSGDVQTIRLGDYITGYDPIISDHRPVVWRFIP